MKRVDDLQISGLSLVQDSDMFCFGIDAVLLSGFVAENMGAAINDPDIKILDLCSGNGVICMLLAAKTKASRIVGLEIQEGSVALARESIELNKLHGRVEVVCGDIKSFNTAKPPMNQKFDIVCANPPYVRYGSGLRNPDFTKAIARHETACNLNDVCRSAAFSLKTGGGFFLVHRPHRLADVICALSSHKLQPKVMRFVHPRVCEPPSLLLVKSVKDGGAGMNIKAPLILYKDGTQYSDEMADKYKF